MLNALKFSINCFGSSQRQINKIDETKTDETDEKYSKLNKINLISNPLNNLSISKSKLLSNSNSFIRQYSENNSENDDNNDYVYYKKPDLVIIESCKRHSKPADVLNYHKTKRQSKTRVNNYGRVVNNTNKFLNLSDCELNNDNGREWMSLDMKMNYLS
jgi:hypothetical protein